MKYIRLMCILIVTLSTPVLGQNRGRNTSEASGHQALVGAGEAIFTFPIQPGRHYQWSSGGLEYTWNVKVNNSGRNYEFGFYLFTPMGAMPGQSGDIHALLRAGQCTIWKVTGQGLSGVEGATVECSVSDDEKSLTIKLRETKSINALLSSRPKYVTSWTQLELFAKSSSVRVPVEYSSARSATTSRKQSAKRPPHSFVVNKELKTHDTIFITDYQGNGVFEVDPHKRKITNNVKISLFNANALAWNKQRNELYVIADNGDNVPIIKLNPLRQIDALTEGIGWNTLSIAVGPTGDVIYLVVSGSNFLHIVILDPATKQVINTIPLKNDPGWAYLSLSRNGKTLYVSWDNHLDAYDTSNLSLVTRENFPDWTSSPLTVSPDGLHLYTSQNGNVTKLSTDSLSIERQISLEGLRHYTPVKISKTGRKLWIPGPRQIYEVPAALTTYRSFRLSADPKGLFGPFSSSIDTDSTEQHLYVLTMAHQMEIINLPTGRVTGIVNGLQEPVSIKVVSQRSDRVEQTGTGFYWPLGRERYVPSRCGTWLGRDTNNNGCYDKGVYHLGVDMYDMLGNVWEWCEDVFHNTYDGAPTDESAWLSEGTCFASAELCRLYSYSRVLQGGSWQWGAESARPASRNYYCAGCISIHFGFRIVAVAQTR